jgi:hypothetical protein
MAAAGARAHISVNVRLATRRGACIVWLTYDPTGFALGAFRWFGGAPDAMLPDLGSKVARSSRAQLVWGKAALGRPPRKLQKPV